MSKNLAISTKKLIIDVADRFKDVSKKATRDLILNFLQQIEDYVATGKKVRLDKLGILQVKDRKARMGRNPQTGEAIRIPASKKVSFRDAGSLKERVGVKKKKTGTKKASPKKTEKKSVQKSAKVKATKKAAKKRKK